MPLTYCITSKNYRIIFFLIRKKRKKYRISSTIVNILRIIYVQWLHI